MAAHDSESGDELATQTLHVDDAPGSSDLHTRPIDPDRYLTDVELGRGGMGEVTRVYDRVLDRTVVRKTVRADRDPTTWERFVAEARVTARLQHPGILPVHDLAVLPDGRPCFTMREVSGATLGDAIDAWHSGTVDGTDDGRAWSLRRLVDAVRQAADAVAYAHDSGVLHRDLKPENIMVGAFGEVLVVDWGLGRASGDDDGDDDARQTRGAIGSPAYMAPEQARGDIAALGTHTDVFGLGATLYQVLTGRPPYQGRVADVLVAAAERALVLPSEITGQRVPEELDRLVAWAMAAEPADRLPSAAAFARELTDWLDGARKREEALRLVSRADELVPEVERLGAEAADLHAQADALLEGLAPHDPAEQRYPAWELQDRATELERERELQKLRFVELLNGALTRDPELEAAHIRLADHYKEQQEGAERRGDGGSALVAEELLRKHDRGAHAGWLARRGQLTIHTDPPGAEVVLRRYVEEHRRLVEGDPVSLGTTPIDGLAVEAGSYLAEIRAPGRILVRYPVLVPKGGHWDGIPLGASEPEPVFLPEAEGWPEGDCYVPAGWCWVGGDPEAPDSLDATRIWIPSFAVGRHPVTIKQYLEFLNAQPADQVQALLPEPEDGPEGEKLRIYLPVDGSGLQMRDARHALHPIVHVSWHASQAYCGWAAQQSGLPWRLPNDLEHEKASRGVDGRQFPWGSHWQATWSRNMEGNPDVASRSAVGAYPIDRSPYGVQDVAGNSRTWCANAYVRRPAHEGILHASRQLHQSTERVLIVIRGGTYVGREITARAASRIVGYPEMAFSSVGLRPVRSVLSSSLQHRLC